MTHTSSDAPRETPQQDRAAPRTEAGRATAEKLAGYEAELMESTGPQVEPATMRLLEADANAEVITIEQQAAAAPALDRIVAELLGQVGFLRSCVASGERLSAVDIERLDDLRDRVAAARLTPPGDRDRREAAAPGAAALDRDVIARFLHGEMFDETPEQSLDLDATAYDMADRLIALLGARAAEPKPPESGVT